MSGLGGGLQNLIGGGGGLGALLGGAPPGLPQITRQGSAPAGPGAPRGPNPLQLRGADPRAGMLAGMDPRMLMAGLGMMMGSRPGPQRTMGLQGALQGLQAGQGLYESGREEDEERRRRQAMQQVAQQMGGQQSRLGGLASQLMQVPGMENQALALLMQGTEPPDTRTIRRGASIVTEEWDPETGQWNEIATAPRQLGGGGGGGGTFRDRLLDQVMAQNPGISVLEAWDRIQQAGRDPEQVDPVEQIIQQQMQRAQLDAIRSQDPQQFQRMLQANPELRVLYPETPMGPQAQPPEADAQEEDGGGGIGGFIGNVLFGEGTEATPPSPTADTGAALPDGGGMGEIIDTRRRPSLPEPMTTTQDGVPDLSMAEIFSQDLNEAGYSEQEIRRILTRAVNRHPQVADLIRGIARRDYGVNIP